MQTRPNKKSQRTGRRANSRIVPIGTKRLTTAIKRIAVIKPRNRITVELTSSTALRNRVAVKCLKWVAGEAVEVVGRGTSRDSLPDGAPDRRGDPHPGTPRLAALVLPPASRPPPAADGGRSRKKSDR